MDHFEHSYCIVSPATDRRVRHPDGRLLEPGDRVTWSTYWQRRLDDADLVEGDTSKKAKAATQQGESN